MRFTDVINESAITRYMEMFNQLPIEVVENKKSRLQRIVDCFKGNRQRLTWALKWYRIHLSFDTIQAPELLKQYTKDFRAMNPETLQSEAEKISTLIAHFEHYLSLPIREIESYRYGAQTPLDVIDDFREFEKKFKEVKQDTVERKPQDEALIQMGRYIWFNLHRGGCEEEAKVMGHCGNGSGNHGETILSLREVVDRGGRTLLRPCLTFILNTNTGNLGEMKGRGNSKPAAKYFPYIEALLELDIVQGILGGGYMPENNFDFYELPQASQKKILAKKPALMVPQELEGCIAKWVGGRWDGNPIHIATFDGDTGEVTSIHTYNTAEENDHHAHFYMDLDEIEAVEDGRYFWIDAHDYSISFQDSDAEEEYKKFCPMWAKHIVRVDGMGNPIGPPYYPD